MDTPLIEFKKVSKRFDSRTILDGVDLTICEGEVTTIIGKSGVGKSVLLKHIIGLLQPDEGEILLHGRPIQALNGKEKMNSLGRISYMFQNNALFDALTVYDNIALPLRYTTRLDKKTNSFQSDGSDRADRIEGCGIPLPCRFVRRHAKAGGPGQGIGH